MVNIVDPLATLRWIFKGGQNLSCRAAADANDDGRISLDDAIHSLFYLFSGDRAMPAPGARSCGFDRTEDPLGYESFSKCR
jgi:hypothetical protein